jgi:hypothetical protein
LKGTRRSFNRISGLQPTSVNVPPRMAQKPMGIRRSERGILSFLLTRWIAGRNRAAAPMFCMKLEMPATVTEMAITIRDVELPAILNTGETTRLMIPVLSRPAPMMITAMMEMTAFELNPTKASFGVTRRSRGRHTIMRMATTSTRIHSTMKRKTATPIMIMTRIISKLSGSMNVLWSGGSQNPAGALSGSYPTG